MIQNIKNIERLIRLSVGGVLLIILFASNIISPLFSYGLPIVGALLIGTALSGFCPAYAIFNYKKKRI